MGYMPINDQDANQDNTLTFLLSTANGIHVVECWPTDLELRAVSAKQLAIEYAEPAFAQLKRMLGA